MQIPFLEGFHVTCSYVLGQPMKSNPSRTHKSRQKTRDGWTSRFALPSLLCLVCLSSPPPPTFFFSDHSYAICSPISHFHSLISHSISLHALDKDRAPHLCLILEHLPLPDDAPLWGIRCSQEFLCELGQKASVFLYRCLVPEVEIGLNNTGYLLF